MSRRFPIAISLFLIIAASGCGRGSLFDYLSNPVRPPFANPAAGTYNDPVQVLFNPSTQDDGLVIYYTADPDLAITDLGAWDQFDYMNGGAPPISIDGPATIRAFSYIDEINFSEVRSYGYVFRPKSPSYWPLPGNVSGDTSVYINPYPETRVYYTLDDSDPSTSPTRIEWTAASAPIGVGDGGDAAHPTSRHIRAIARSTIHGNWLDSVVAEGFYTYVAPGSEAMGMTMTLPNGTVMGFDGTVPALELEEQDLIVASNPVSPLAGPFSYAWTLSGELLTETGNSVTLGANGPAGRYPLGEGVYRIICVLTDGSGVQHSSSLYFTVIQGTQAQAGLDITLALPEAATVSVTGDLYLELGTSYTFTAALAGASVPIVSCEWFLNGASVGSGMSLNLSLAAIGSYELSCVVGAGGFAYSRTILLFVVNP